MKNNNGYELLVCIHVELNSDDAISLRLVSQMPGFSLLTAASASRFPFAEEKQRSLYHHNSPSFIDPASAHIKLVGETEIATISL